MTDACAVPGRRPRRVLGWVVAALVVVSVLALDWNLVALSSLDQLGAALDRVALYLRGFGSPDLSAAMLAKCAKLAVETLAIAFLGVAVGLVLGYPLALGATRCLVRGEDPAHPLVRALQRAVLEVSRFVLDVLRGVPDIAWAIVLANLTGVNATTGVLAIGISVAGIFGKVLSEQWDNVDPVRYAALRSTGASRGSVFLYGVQPLAARTMLSFLLMRTECAVRNASVIGVVGGGGLGAYLWDVYTDGDWSAVATVVFALLAVTATTDLLANVMRQRLRVDPNHPRAHAAVDRAAQARRRWQALAVATGLVVASAASLGPALASAWTEVGRIDWDFAGPYTVGLFQPDLSGSTVASALGHAVVPLAIGVLATVIAMLAAGALAYPASVAFQLDAHRFTGENPPAWRRRARWALVLATRGLALVLRGVPEVAWVILLSVFFQQGVTACVLAVAVHSCGVLHRVFTESLDNVAYTRLEKLSGACRPHVFAYAALPRAWPDWRTYTFFQFEVNMRIGVALGVVGAGGLGHGFKMNLDWRQHGVAATFLWTMILLTVLIDRTSRWLQLRRNRC